MKHKKTNRGPRAKGIRIPFAFKTAAIYTLLFSVILVAAVTGLTSAYTTYSVQSQNLDRIAAFVAGHYERPDFPEQGTPPGGGNSASASSSRPEEGDFSSAPDLESFAEANRVYIEIKNMDTGALTSYGNKSFDSADHMQSVRRVNSPVHRLMVRVVNNEDLGFAGMPITVFIGLIAFMLLLSAVFGGMLIRKMLSPVYDMTRTARSISSANDLSTRINIVDSHDELKEMAETFNGMLDRIQDSYEKQRRFVSDASHELRTPLSVVSGYANLLRRWGSQNQDVLQESVGKIIEETDNMQQLVDRLLFLARADQNTQHVRFERFDASDMMHEIAEETRMIDEEHTLQEDVPPGVILTADRALLKQAVRAIVDNSIKYTPPGGKISLSCREMRGCVELEIADTGIGIAEKDLPHIFDRFYKADEARTRGKGSTGLGLSITRWIVERHRGSIRVESKPGEGTKFVICLPKAQAALPEKTE